MRINILKALVSILAVSVFSTLSGCAGCSSCQPQTPNEQELIAEPIPTTEPVLCGNSKIDSGEECDNDNFGGKSCRSIDSDFVGGTPSCNSDCTLDLSDCESRTGGGHRRRATPTPTATPLPTAPPGTILSITKDVGLSAAGPFSDSLNTFVGTLVWYQIKVKNLTTTSITGVTLSDTLASPLNCGVPIPSSLNAGE